MLTVDALKDYGANTQEGLGRCFNNEAFYLRLVGMGLADKNFDALRSALDAGDAKAAFEAAHAAKGVCQNLALTSLGEPASAICEALRPGNDDLRAATDVDARIGELRDAYARAIDAIDAFERGR